MTNMIDYALAYAKKEHPVFPLAAGTKVPAIPKRRGGHGFKDATTNEHVIRAWWDERPGANIGMPTGAVSGLIVIDEDPRNQGDASMLNLPRTLTARTPNGGRHFYFRHPGGTVKVQCSTGELALGIDVKGDGGYAVLVPSILTSGGSYEWVDLSVPIAKLPPHHLPKLTAKPDPSSHNGAHPASDEGEPILEGHRNKMLASLAGSMRCRGMTQREIEAALLAVNAARCDPPLSEDEVRKIAASVSRYESGVNGNTHTFPPPPDNGAGDTWESMGNNDEADGNAGGRTGEHYWPGVVRLSEVKKKARRWLWHPYLVRNKANVWEGDPGVGKSLMVARLTAVETKGEEMDYDTRPGWALGHPFADGKDHDPGGSVLLLAGEDDTADTILPRVEAAGGDTSRVIVLEKVPYEDDKGVTRYRRPRVPSDTATIMLIVRGEKCRLLVVDPITSFLDKDVSPNNDTEIRAALDPLVDGCAEVNCTTLFLRHLNKGSGQSALYRGAGSIGIAGLARSVCMVAQDPDAREGVEQHVFAHVKSNVAKLGVTLVFQKVVPVGTASDTEPTIDWKGTSTRTGDEIYRLLAQKLAGQSSEERSALLGKQLNARLCKAVKWLRNHFAAADPNDGGLPSREVIAQGQAAGLSERDVRNAGAYLKIRHSREGFQGPVYWHYDPKVAPPPDEDEGQGDQEVA